MKKCPKCGYQKFYVTAHVTQDWLVDENEDFIRVVDDCVVITHKPSNDDIWVCGACGYDAAGKEFEVEEE